jgi:hypothetical protein
MSFSPETLRPRLSAGLPLQALMSKSTIALEFYGQRGGTVKPGVVGGGQFAHDLCSRCADISLASNTDPEWFDITCLCAI